MRVSGNGGNFQHPDPGTVNAICVRIVDLGTQEVSWQGKAKKQRKVMIGWEIEQLMDDGRPFLVVQRYTASIHPKSVLGQHLESWRGQAFTDEEREGFDLAKLLGAPCLLTLVKNGDYTNVASVSKLPKSMAHLEPKGPLCHLDLDNFSPEVFDTLSENVKLTIEKSPEYAKACGRVPSAPSADDIPF